MKLEYLILLLIIFFALIIRLYVLNIQGEMYDEYAVVTNGEIYIGALKNLDFSRSTWSIGYEHPPLAKYLYGSASVIEENVPYIENRFDYNFHPDKRYFLARFLSIILGLANIILIYVIGKKWFNKWVGLISASILAMLPHFIAHNTIAGLETLQALLSTILVFYAVEYFIKKKISYIYFSFITTALFFLTKFTGVFYYLFYLVLPFIWDKSYKNNIPKYLIKYLKIYMLPLVLSFLVIFLLWPWLWLNPLNLIESFGYFSPTHEGEYFMGSTSQPPMYYYFVYLFGTTPPFVLATSIFGLIYGLYKFKDINRKYILSVILWFFIPFIISFIGLKQDGLRYVFSFIPALCLLSGIGLYQIINLLKNNFLKVIIPLLLYTSIFWSLWKFYPYYLDYYNILVGGSRNVYEKKLMDFAWWGEGIKESVLYINNNYENKNVTVILTPSHTAPLFDEDLTLSTNLNSVESKNTDLVIISENEIERNPQLLPFLDEYRNVFNSDVNGISLVRVYERE